MRLALVVLSSLAVLATGCKEKERGNAQVASATPAPIAAAGVPLAKNATPARTDIPLVKLEAGAVTLDGAAVAPMPPGDGHVVPLTQRLGEWKRAFVAQKPGVPFPGAARLALDAGERASVLRRVGESMVRAGFPTADLVVRHPDGPDGTLPLGLPVPMAPSHPHSDSACFVLAKGGTFRLVWKNPEAVFWTDEVASPAGLAPLVEAEWRKHGAHRAESDRAQDLAVLVLADDLRIATLVDLVDVLVGPRRRVGFGKATEDLSVLTVSLAQGTTLPLPEDLPKR